MINTLGLVSLAKAIPQRVTEEVLAGTERDLAQLLSSRTAAKASFKIPTVLLEMPLTLLL